jgi:dipeptidase D
LYLPEPKVDAAKAKIKEVEGHLKSEFEKTDPKLSLTLEPAEVSDQQAMTADDTRKVVDFLAALPHGVDFMSNDIPGLVETSNNLATVRTEGGKVAALTSQRSSVMERMFVLTQKIESVCRLAGGTYETGSGYPSWEPDMSSPILAKCKKIYEDLFDKEPVVEIIHAGLECGIIGSKYPGMDMISFGPTIKNPHSPDEMLELPTVGMVWDFTVELLKSLK